ncbi:MAG: TsaB protein, required for threonylcarbamoyladenosine (t(6)A) formation in tRNA [uncultured Sulfurovum sp.]|uniref:TsaB protein, required for threonylcarbamoyladenosine (T(6)A) formation in tRNA n=1 Tax=uncultured Sulfurovum sp. TaxID=269237 RepID=A0A6S6TT03_9BACT|nr:MAG: TsaB protein, required for threonylcarbamoyladenosine (t(6)A) formation in tRNA [uncultured Sulfurovum sp.]
MSLLLLNLCKVEHLQNLLPKKYTLLIISISSPILVGVYEDGLLIKKIESTKKTSEILLPIIVKELDLYDISNIIYTRGPGSYMAIKLTYIILKTIEITRNIHCIGCSGFLLNDNKPIKAIGNLYFIKEKETIITKKYEQPVNINFILPQSIHDLPIDEESTPEYILPAV